MRKVIAVVLVFFSMILASSAASAAWAIADITGANIPGESWAISYNASTMDVAIREVKKTCKELFKKHGKKIAVNKKTCNVFQSKENTLPVYIAIYTSKDDRNIGVSSHTNRQAAVDNAYEQCTYNGRVCSTHPDSVMEDTAPGANLP